MKAIRKRVTTLKQEALQILAEERAIKSPFGVMLKRATFTIIVHIILFLASPSGWLFGHLFNVLKGVRRLQFTLFGLQIIWLIVCIGSGAFDSVNTGIDLYISFNIAFFILFAQMEGFVMSSWGEMKYIFIRDNSPDAELKRDERKKERRLERRRQEVAQAIEGVSPKGDGKVYLGGIVSDDVITEIAGLNIETINKVRWLSMDAKRLAQSLVVIGQPGSGKTTCATAIVDQLLRNNPELRIIVVDGKGSSTWANELATLGYQYKGIKVPIFKIGYTESGSAFNGFEGGTDQIFNRLGILLGFNKAETSGQMHYTAMDINLLGFVCGSSYKELRIPPPRNFDDLYQRANATWLLAQYGGIHEARDLIEAYQKAGVIVQFKSKLMSLGSSFRDIITNAGFGFNDVPMSIFSIKTTVQGLDSQRFLDWFIEVLKYYIGNEVRGETVVIIDEFPAFNNKTVGDVLSIGREAGVGTILLAQDAGAIEPKALRRKIMGHPLVKILLKSDYPEDMIELAGTVNAYEKGMQFDGEDEESTGRGTRRIQHQFRVSPNEVRQLQAGCGFAITSGHACKIQFGYLGEIEVNKDAIETRYDVERIRLGYQEVQEREEQEQRQIIADGELTDEDLRNLIGGE